VSEAKSGRIIYAFISDAERLWERLERELRNWLSERVAKDVVDSLRRSIDVTHFFVFSAVVDSVEQAKRWARRWAEIDRSGEWIPVAVIRLVGEGEEEWTR